MVDNQNLRKIPELWASELLPIKFDYLTLPDSSSELSHRCGTNFADYKILLENYLLTITNILISIQTQVPQKKWGWGKGGTQLQKPERALCSPVLELQAVISHLTWTLGTKLRSSGRNPVSLCTVSPAPDLCLFLRQSWYVSRLSAVLELQMGSHTHLGNHCFPVLHMPQIVICYPK